jgi:hypothetical protein
MNVIWTNGNDWASSQSRALLNTKLVEYEERDVRGPFWTKDDLYKEHPNAILPLIVLEGEIIKGWEELFNHYKWYP